MTQRITKEQARTTAEQLGLHNTRGNGNNDPATSTFNNAFVNESTAAEQLTAVRKLVGHVNQNIAGDAAFQADYNMTNAQDVLHKYAEELATHVPNAGVSEVSAVGKHDHTISPAVRTN
jgi:hypothetical protein